MYEKANEWLMVGWVGCFIRMAIVVEAELYGTIVSIFLLQVFKCCLQHNSNNNNYNIIVICMGMIKNKIKQFLTHPFTIFIEFFHNPSQTTLIQLSVCLSVWEPLFFYCLLFFLFLIELFLMLLLLLQYHLKLWKLNHFYIFIRF